MKLINYIKNKYISIFFNIIIYILIMLLLIIFNVNFYLIIIISLLLLCTYILNLSFDFIKRKLFYHNFSKHLNNLDQKYLITEIIKECNFIDGQIFLEYLYDINKSMHENVNKYKLNKNEFKEYIELWCHEIKTPIATSKLIIENNSNDITNSILEEVEAIDKFVEQVLFYSRSNTVEKDYIIAVTDLKKVIENIIRENKKVLIRKKIKIEINELPTVKTDIKWIHFIINQIISNSIKYGKGNNDCIKIYSKINKNNTMLMIEDNGIGIEENEIAKVFDKGFTGSNGRKKYNSTGIGLYLCKKLCLKLGHDIYISSKINEKTIITIIFPNNDLTMK
ncbi:MAG: sensor histidine kinase [Bacilli bacterium]|nr:sensor histidine kinase [Bacilli bacterium]